MVALLPLLLDAGRRRGAAGVRGEASADAAAAGFGGGRRRRARRCRGRRHRLPFSFSFSVAVAVAIVVVIISAVPPPPPPPETNTTTADAQHEPREESHLPVLRGHVHGPVPSLVGGLDARPGAQQLLGRRQAAAAAAVAVAAHRRPVKRRLPRRVRGVDLRSGLQQQAHGGDAAVEGCPL